jgi:hypothetical protein
LWQRSPGVSPRRARASSLALARGKRRVTLSAEKQALRRRLRAHGRQLGDRRDDKRGAQATGRLIQALLVGSRFLLRNLEVAQKVRPWTYAGDRQTVSRARAGDVKELALGLIDIIELDLVGDGFDA